MFVGYPENWVPQLHLLMMSTYDEEITMNYTYKTFRWKRWVYRGYEYRKFVVRCHSEIV